MTFTTKCCINIEEEEEKEYTNYNQYMKNIHNNKNKTIKEPNSLDLWELEKIKNRLKIKGMLR